MDAISKAEGIVLRQEGERVEEKNFQTNEGEITKKFSNILWAVANLGTDRFFVFGFVFNDLSMILSQ